MTQKAAASLSSSLFARKGKASPASLLISEMAAAGDGAAGKSAANGGARRRPKAEADLPLLAYVEAQTENDNETAGEALEAAAGAAPEAETETPEAPQLAKAEPPPAASLLERGARPLRRANGRKPGLPAQVATPPHRREDDDSPPVVRADLRGDLEPDETMAAETVSGDANVAAIEDASDDDVVAEGEAPAAGKAATEQTVEAESVSVEAADAPLIVEAADAAPSAEDKAESAVVVPPVAEESGAEDKPADGAAPPAAVKAAAQDKAAAAITASMALRHAKTLNVETVPRAPAPALAAERPQAPPPRPRVAGQLSRSYLWRGAAVVVLGAALGFGAYLVFAGEPAQSPAPVAAALPEPAAEPAAEATADAPAAPVETAAAPETAAAATEAPAAPVLPEPSFDIIRIEPDGQSIIAGRAEPFSEWILLNNGTPIASLRADANGEWVVLPDASLVPGANAFSLVPKTERGKVAIPAPEAAAPQDAPANQGQANEAPANEAPANEAQVPGEARPEGAVEGAVQKSAPGAAELAGLLLPKPKPLLEPAAGETSAPPAPIQVSADGAYEVQLASVRRSADAARERDRLAVAFPQLLGGLALQVREATVEGAGIFYRVRSGAIADLGLARDICRQLEAGGQGCLVVRRGPAAPAPAPVTELVEEVPAEPVPSAAGQQAERPQ